AAGALHIYDELPRYAHGDFAAAIVLNERERKIDARRNAGGGPHGIVANEDGIRLQLDSGIARTQSIARRPVRDGLATIEQAGFGEYERTRAHRAHATNARSVSRHPADELRIAQCAGHVERARHDERVDVDVVVARERVGEDRETVRRLDGTAF